MRAAYYERYGAPEVLQCGDQPRPVAGRGEVLVAVEAAALNPKDVLIRKGKFALFTGRGFPRIPGFDFAGRVVTAARGFAEGAPVFGMVQSWRGGTCADYVRCPVSQLAPWPEALSAQQAAAIPLAAQTALQALRNLLAVQPGERVCVNGAAGGVGLFAIQIARILGAEVTAVCSRASAERVLRHGADAVVAYDERDPTQPDRPYDVLFDVFGNLPFPAVRAALTPTGRYATTIPSLRGGLQDLKSRFSRQSAYTVVVRSRRADLELLAGWATDGRLTPVVDRSFELADSRAAHAYLETRRARGKVVVCVGPS